MLLKEGKEFKEFAIEETRDIKHSRDFSEQLKDEYLLRDNTRRGILITGL